MSAANGAIAALDEALADLGRTVTLRRLATGPDAALTPFDCECLAVVSQETPSDFAGAAGDAPDTKLILSPTMLLRRQWPGPGLPPVPRRNDRVLIGDDVLTVEAVAVRDVAGIIVRIELHCRGGGNRP